MNAKNISSHVLKISENSLVLRTREFTDTVKPVFVATSIKQATCIKQASVQFPKQANTLKCTYIKQAPVLSKQILIVP